MNSQYISKDQKKRCDIRTGVKDSFKNSSNQLSFDEGPALTPPGRCCRAEATNARVAWFSVGSLLICVVLAAWQLYYLKQFFHKKKLL